MVLDGITQAFRPPIVQLLLFLLLANNVFANDVRHLAVPGTLSGDFSVNSGGAATYTIPIQLSPGTAGMQPAISLQYSSQAGPSAIARGWSIGGLSSITRGRKNLQDDGKVQGITLTNSDALFLDGQKLVAVGSYGSSTHYRTLINNHSRIERKLDSETGEDYFVVYTKAGLIMEYRQRVKISKDKILTWLCTEVRDTLGNYIDFTYWVKKGEYGIEKISYTGNHKTGQKPYASLTFNYEDLPPYAQRTQYLLGYRILASKQLKNIESHYGLDHETRRLFRRYELSFKPSASASGELFLESIQEFGESGQWHEPTTFTYADVFADSTEDKWQKQNTISFPDLPVASKREKEKAFAVLDLNDDSFADLIYSEDIDKLYTKVYLGGKNGWVESVDNEYHPKFALASALDRDWRLVDLDGNGAKEILLGAVDGFKSEIYRLESKKWVRNERLTAIKEIHQDLSRLHFIDFDNDGDSDLIVPSDKASSQFKAFEQSSGEWIQKPSYNLETNDLSVLDIDCDGESDLVAFDYLEGTQQLLFQSYFSRNGKWGKREELEDIVIGGVIPKKYSIIKEDFDADGCQDLIINYQRELNYHSYFYKSTKDGLKLQKGLSESLPVVLLGREDSSIFSQLDDSFLELIITDGESTKIYGQKFDDQGVLKWEQLIISTELLPFEHNTTAYSKNKLDINGDGIDELLLFHTEKDKFDPKLFELKSNAWQLALDRQIPINIAKFDKADLGVQFIDLNGDGLQDLVSADKSYKNTGAGWEIFPENNYKPPVRIALDNGGDTGTRIVDVNGDGLVDFIYAYKEKNTGNIKRSVHLNTGTTWGGSSKKYTHALNENNVLFTVEGEGPTGTQMVDLNGDGLVDIIHSHAESVYENTAYSLINHGPNEGWKLNSAYSICTSTFDSYCIQLSLKAQKRYANQQQSPEFRNYSTGSQIIDLNGDSLPDILFSYRFAELAWTTEDIAQAKERWNDANNNLPYPPALENAQVGQVNTYEDCYEPDRSRCNEEVGDRKQRNLIIKSGALINTGTGWTFQSRLFNSSMPRFDGAYNENDQRSDLNHILSGHAVDHNSDGLLDLHFVERRWVSGLLKKSYKVFTNTGDGFKLESDSVWNLQSQIFDDSNVFDFGIRYIEINGDGKIDALQAIQKEDGSAYKYEAWLNNGSTWVVSSEYKPKLPFARIKRGEQGVRLVDVNGDGLLDYLQNFKDSNNGKEEVKKSVYLNLGNSIPLLTAIKDGHGNQTHVKYQSMSYAVSDKDKVYQPDPIKKSSWPAIQVVPPAHLVRSSSIHIPGYKSSNEQPFNTTYYRYGGFRVNAKSGQPMGFAWREERNPLTKIKNTSYYIQNCDGNDLKSCYNVGKQYKYTSEFLKHPEQPLLLLEKFNDYKLVKGADDDYLKQIYMMKSLFSTEIKLDETGNQTGYKSEKIIYAGKENQYIEETRVVLAPNTPEDSASFGQLEQFYQTYTINEYDNESLDWNGKWHLARLTKSTVTRSNEKSTNDPTTFDTRVSCFIYDEKTGLIISERENCGHEKELQTSYKYDDYGNKIASTISASGIAPRTSKVIYDEKGRLPVSTINPLNHESRVLTFDQAKAIPLESQDANKLISRSWIDDFGNVVRSLDPTGLESFVSYYWFEDGCNENERACFIKQTEVKGLPPVKTIYDAASREIESIGIGFAGEPVVQKTIYNILGKVEKSSIPVFKYELETNDKSNKHPWIGNKPTLDESCVSIYQKYPDFKDETVKKEDYKSRWTYYYYDSLGREKATLLPDGGLVCTDHNSGEKISYDQLQNKSITKFDYQLRPSVTINALGGETRFYYDHAGRLTETINALGQSIVHQYNDLGEKVSTDDPDLGYWQYAYDPLGQLIKQTDAKQHITYLHYDLLGRLVKKVQADKTAHWHYDSSPKGTGQLSWVGDSDGYIEKYYYDEFSRQKEVHTTVNSQNYRQTVTYDELGRVETTRSPTGYLQRNNFDTNGFLYLIEGSQINSSFEALWEAGEYDAVGRVISERLGNGVSNHNVYNQYSGHLRETCSRKLETSASLTKSLSCESSDNIQYQIYQYDLVDNLISKVDRINRREMQHKFDELGRLERVNHKNKFKTDTFEYDAIGNFIRRSDIGEYIYASDPNLSKSRLAKIKTADGIEISTYLYDPNGNTIQSNKGVFTYTSENLVREIRKGKKHFSQFRYSPGGQRYYQDYRHGRRHIKTTYLGSYEKIEEIGAEPLFPTSDRIRHRHYISSPSGVVGVVEEIDWLYPRRHSRNFELLAGFEKPENTVKHTLKKSFFLKDSLGSITTVLDSNAEVTDRFEYDAWGKRIEENKEKYNTYRLGYTGHEHLDNLGLIHMNGRIYDPDIGRFISADPFIQAPNNSQNYARYSYVVNNPYKYVDPSGFFFKKLWKAATDPFKKIWNVHKQIFNEVNKWLKENWREVVTVVVVVAVMSVPGLQALGPVVAGMVSGFVGGATSAALYGGNLSDVLSAGIKGAVIGGITAGMADAWGNANHGIANKWGMGQKSLGRALGHGVSGGIASEMKGGKFMQGFGSAAFTHYASANVNVDGIEGFEGEQAARVSVDAAIGGTASVIGGGKFSNGAVTGAYQSMFNRETERAKRKTIDSTAEALMHYIEGSGEPVELGSETISALKNSPRHKQALTNILSGNTQLSGNYAVNLQSEMFHVGDTAVHYSTICSGSSCTTTFTGFVQAQGSNIIGSDSFSDPFDIGVEISKPYNYTPHVWKETFRNPNYLIGAP